MPIDDATKAEIAEAVRIVREDRFEAHARGVLGEYRGEKKEEEAGKKEEEGKKEGEEEEVVKGQAPPPKEEQPPIVKKKMWGNYADE